MIHYLRYMKKYLTNLLRILNGYITRTSENSEWDLLKEVCNELYPDEELLFESLYSLIDIENKASGINQRKGILDELNSAISKTHYKNEEDATAFYSNTMIRKKENGGKYNEKFLDYEQSEEEFEEDEEQNL